MIVVKFLYPYSKLYKVVVKYNDYIFKSKIVFILIGPCLNLKHKCKQFLLLKNNSDFSLLYLLKKDKGLKIISDYNWKERDQQLIPSFKCLSEISQLHFGCFPYICRRQIAENNFFYLVKLKLLNLLF